MLEFIGSASASFSASHIVEGHLRCGRLHGHRWRVTASIATWQDPKTGDLVGVPKLADAVTQLARELDRQHLNSMLPGSQPTATGVGLAFRERMSMHWQNIESITVEMDDESSTIRG